MRSGPPLAALAAWAALAALPACGPDIGDQFDFAVHDLRPEPPDFSPHADAATGDLPAVFDLAGCGCSATAPSPACQANAIVTFTAPGMCEADLDAGAMRCVYPSTSSPCTNGCFYATCTGPLSFLGNTNAYVNGTAMADITNGTAAAGMPVTIVTQTYPPGSASDVHVVYTKSTDPGFTMKTDAVMIYDKFTMNNDQWYSIIPAQTAGTTIVWYLYADGYGSTTPLYYSNFGNNFKYTSN